MSEHSKEWDATQGSCDTSVEGVVKLGVGGGVWDGVRGS